MKRTVTNLIMKGAAVIAWVASSASFISFGNAQVVDEPKQVLGSTATLEELTAKETLTQKNRWKRADREVVNIRVVDAVLPERALLANTLTTGLSHLKPGSAQRHFFRALLAYNSLPPADRQEIAELHEADMDAIPADALQKVLEPFEIVFQELMEFSRCEDLEFDLRGRDIDPIKRVQTVLPEIQQARELAILLRAKAIQRIKEKDFAEMLDTVRIGIRLSQFIEQGESLVEQLVAFAIRGMMLDCIQIAIQSEGCPNLYYHLAMLQPDIKSLARAIEFDGKFLLDLELLKSPEQRQWTEAEWIRQWSQSIDQMKSVFRRDSTLAEKTFGAVFVVGQVGQSKANLQKAGYSDTQLATMGPYQIVAIDTAQRLNLVRNSMRAAVYLPYSESQNAFDEIENMIKTSERPQDIFQVITQATLPSLKQIVHAHYRLIAQQRLYMTFESIREFAARNGGQLPKSLDELGRPHATTNVFDDQPFKYEVEMVEEIPTATLSFESNTLPASYRTIRFQIRK